MTMNKNFSHYVKQIRLKCTRDLVYLEVPLVKVLGLLVAVQADHLRVVVADVPVRLLGEEEKVNQKVGRTGAWRRQQNQNSKPVKSIECTVCV